MLVYGELLDNPLSTTSDRVGLLISLKVDVNKAHIVSEENEIERIAAVLEDATARTILTETSQEPMSATTLSDRCDVSEPTVYRRLEDLRECEVLVEHTEIDPDEGHHRTIYSTNRGSSTKIMCDV